MTNKEAYEWLNQPGIRNIMPTDPQSVEAINRAMKSLMFMEELPKIIDELKYEIKDGCNLPGCRFRFSTDTYEGAIGALILLEKKIRKLR